MADSTYPPKLAPDSAGENVTALTVPAVHVVGKALSTIEEPIAAPADVFVTTTR